MSDSKVFLFDDADPEMQNAHEKARSTFRYLWREIAWERRRIVPGLDLAAVKAPFSDGKDAPKSDEHPSVEHMWVNEIDFDGKLITGTLLNQPNWLKNHQKGDNVRIRPSEISDWMYGQMGEVYGAYTVNLLRSRMKPRERKEHDDMWGLSFGDPNSIRVVPSKKKSGGLLKSLFGKREEPAAEVIGEHPMSENMGPPFREQLTKNPEMVNGTDDSGWTLLHHQALAGSLTTVTVLLELGANVNAKTGHGMTALQLAKSLNWDKVVALLASKGAR